MSKNSSWVTMYGDRSALINQRVLMVIEKYIANEINAKIDIDNKIVAADQEFSKIENTTIT